MSDTTLTQTCEHGKTEAHFVNPQNDQWSWCKCPTMSELIPRGRVDAATRSEALAVLHAYADGDLLSRVEAANDPEVQEMVAELIIEKAVREMQEVSDDE